MLSIEKLIFSTLRGFYTKRNDFKTNGTFLLCKVMGHIVISSHKNEWYTGQIADLDLIKLCEPSDVVD